jgi:uncharacterized protein RhaS with RHS repeats
MEFSYEYLLYCLPVIEEYTYDENGNRLTKMISGQTTTYTYGSANQLSQINSTTQTYDVSGNLTNDGTYTYEWDSKDRLTKVKRISDNQVIVSYTYDSDGQRTSKTIP